MHVWIKGFVQSISRVLALIALSGFLICNGDAHADHLRDCPYPLLETTPGGGDLKLIVRGSSSDENCLSLNAKLEDFVAVLNNKAIPNGSGDLSGVVNYHLYKLLFEGENIQQSFDVLEKYQEKFKIFGEKDNLFNLYRSVYFERQRRKFKKLEVVPMELVSARNLAVLFSKGYANSYLRLLQDAEQALLEVEAEFWREKLSLDQCVMRKRSREFSKCERQVMAHLDEMTLDADAGALATAILCDVIIIENDHVIRLSLCRIK